MLIKGMTAQEIRVLQEFRRITSDTMSLAAVKAIVGVNPRIIGRVGTSR